MSDAPLLRPLDAHNLRHLAQVHPADHVNPTPRDRYHLVVLGAGTGGLVAAAASAGLGAKVALVERHLMGGDCLNVGCVPSKAIIRAARAWDDARRGAARFGAPAAAGDGDFAAVMERMRRLRADLGPVDGVPRFRSLGVDVFLGEGRFAGPDVVEVGGARLRFRRAVIATGARAAMPAIPGLAEAAPYTNESIFNLTERPRRLVVLGAGPIGCELAQAFARLGCEVTVVTRTAGILPREDPDAAAIVAKALAADGVRHLADAAVVEVRRGGGAAVGETTLTLERAGRRETLACDALLVATGRTPNVEGIGLERAGVGVAKDGIAVDDGLRTANRRIYAVGDVVTPDRFTHVSDAHARIVVQNAHFFGRARVSRLVVPRCTYTSPEVAAVGLSPAAAARAGIAIETLTLPLEANDRARLDGADDGFLRLHLKAGTDRILGATLVAEHAGEMIGEMCLAITTGVGLGRIAGTVHPYPTQGEIFRRAADTWRRGRLTPSVRRLFATWFRIFR
jgi:pyruvate/2-oxoglutarate dehydrogenase complex dihydrolipoamide dehydrogenase (E3) component